MGTLNVMFQGWALDMYPKFSKSISLEELVTRILISRRVTMSDRLQLMNIFLQEALDEAELVLIDRLIYGVRKGILQLADW